jgi:SAM-dependent methyltransferase
MTRDVIQDHDRIAEVYKYRTPYGEEFFAKLANGLGIGSETAIIDLCCGTGAVAAGLAGYCKTVVAVDGAGRMIAEAPKVPNISYHVYDINSANFDEFVKGRRFDFISIGMGVHWLDADTIAKFRNYLLHDGKIIILATGFSEARLNAWLPGYENIRRSIKSKEPRDWTGKSYLQAQGFQIEDIIHTTYRAHFPLRFFTDHLLSYSAENEAISRNYESVSALIDKHLKNYASDGKVECFWTSSARIFCDNS